MPHGEPTDFDLAFLDSDPHLAAVRAPMTPENTPCLGCACEVFCKLEPPEESDDAPD